MAKFAIFASALAVLAPLAAARNCTPGLAYCGKTLTDIGEYDAQITSALLGADRATTSDYKEESLFYCSGGSEGAISFITKCDGTCHNAGTGSNDYC